MRKNRATELDQKIIDRSLSEVKQFSYAFCVQNSEKSVQLMNHGLGVILVYNETPLVFAKRVQNSMQVLSVFLGPFEHSPLAVVAFAGV